MGQALAPAPAGNEVHYERRRPEETTLYQVAQEHLESFLVQVEAETGASLPESVKSLDTQQRRWLKRRQAIEPAIGHTKSDDRMDRCRLGGSSADALHAVLCAAGFNIRWLLRAIAAKGLVALHLLFSQVALDGARIGNRAQFASDTVVRSDRHLAWRRWPITPRLATG